MVALQRSKAAADMLLARTPADGARDADILEAGKKVEAARQAETAAARRAAAAAGCGGPAAVAAAPAFFSCPPLDFAPPDRDAARRGRRPPSAG